MLGNHIVLPGSYSASLDKVECHRCNQPKSKTDGVYMGSKFVCGKCWRTYATAGSRKKGKK